MAKRNPTEAQDASAAAPGGRRSARRPSDMRDVHFEQPAGGTPEQQTSEADSGQPTFEEIRTRAYHRYLERGGGHGMDFEDWLEAERELKQGR